MKQTLQLKVSAQLALTPQLQQSIKLLQMSTLELQEEIERRLQENPMLDQEDGSETLNAPSTSADAYERKAEESFSEREKDEPPLETTYQDNFDTWADNVSFSIRNESSHDDDVASYESFVAAEESLREYLNKQLSLTPVTERDRRLIQVLIECLDDDGFLTQSLEDILEVFPYESDVTLEELTIALALLQHFDPPGVGARNAVECLRLQLDADNKDAVTQLAFAIVDHHLDRLAARDYVRLKRLLNCDDEMLKRVIELIMSLNPRPGAAFSSISTRYIVPDVVVKKLKGKWVVMLNEEAMPKLRINQLYASLLKGGTINKKEGDTLNGQLQEARWFIRNIHQRYETILRVATTIIERQLEFLEHGDISMRPLVLKEIAETLDLHESTISRVTNQKYIQTPRGIYELKYFFGSHCHTETGGACSATAIKALIRQLIEQENAKKPLSDNKIAQLLGEQGIVVARRTVAKYRELLHIPPVNQRKSI